MSDERQLHIHYHTHYHGRRNWWSIIGETIGWLSLGGAMVIVYAVIAYK